MQRRCFSRQFLGCWIFILLLGGAITTYPATAQNTTVEQNKSMYILLDISGSMQSGTRISDAQASVATLLNQLQREGGWRVGLITGTGDNIVIPLGLNNEQRIIQHVNSLHFSGGNPITSLDRFVDRVLAANRNQCHIVIVITDGDDGSNPRNSAQRIQQQCSILHIVGVELGSIGTLSAAATAGNGNFCNARERAQLLGCVLSVLRAFRFDEQQQACVNSQGVRGLNPAPTDVRLISSLEENWRCMDFRQVSTRPGNVYPAFFHERADYRGSNFSGLNLSGLVLRGNLGFTNFSGANLQQVTVQLGAGMHRVNFSNAQLHRIVGPGVQQSCLQGINLRTNSAYSMQDIALCQPLLPERLGQLSYTRVRLQGAQLQNQNLHISSAARFNDVHFHTLRFNELLVPATPALLQNLTLEQLTGQRLVLHASTGSEIIIRDSTVQESLQVNTAQSLQLERVTGGAVILNQIRDVGFVESTVANLQADHGREFMARNNGILNSATISYYAAVQLRDMPLGFCRSCTFSQGGLQMTNVGFGRVTFNNISSWQAHNIAMASLNAEQVRLSAQTSSLSQANILAAVWRNSSVAMPMRDVELVQSRWLDGAYLTVVDGSANINFDGAEFAHKVDIPTRNVSNLRFSNLTKPAILDFGNSGQTHTFAELNTTESSIEIRAQAAFQCERCTFTNSAINVQVSGPVTLMNSRAERANVRISPVTLNIEGGNFQHSQWPNGAGNMNCFRGDFSGATLQGMRQGSLQQCNFTRATIAGLWGVESFASDFSHATITTAIADSEFVGGRFSQATMAVAVSPVAAGRVAFANTHFDGANFSDGNISRMSFENVAFNGPSGPAQGLAHKHMQHVTMQGVAMQGVDLQHVKVLGSRFAFSNFRDANLSYSEFLDESFDAVQFDGANLNYARLCCNLRDIGFSNTNLDNALLAGQLVNAYLDTIRGRISGLPSSMHGVSMRGLQLPNTLLYSTLASSVSTADFRQLDVEGSVVACYWRAAIENAGAEVRGRLSYAFLPGCPVE